MMSYIYENMNLGFLYESRPAVMDGPELEYDRIYNPESRKLSAYLKTSSIPQVIRLITWAYRTEYSKYEWLTRFETEFNLDTESVIRDGYYIFEHETLRNGINSVKFKLFYDEEIEEELYVITELHLALDGVFEVQHAVEDGLGDVPFNKIENSDMTEFNVNRGPIDKIEITTSSYHLYLHKESVIYRGLA